MSLHFTAIGALHPRGFQQETQLGGRRLDGRLSGSYRRPSVLRLPPVRGGSNFMVSLGSTKVICGARIGVVRAEDSAGAGHDVHFEVQHSALADGSSARAGLTGIGAGSIAARQPREALKTSRLLHKVFQRGQCLDLSRCPSCSRLDTHDKQVSGAPESLEDTESAPKRYWRISLTCIVVADDGSSDAACVVASAMCLKQLSFPWKLRLPGRTEAKQGGTGISASSSRSLATYNLLVCAPIPVSFISIGAHTLLDPCKQEEGLADSGGIIVVAPGASLKDVRVLALEHVASPKTRGSVSAAVGALLLSPEATAYRDQLADLIRIHSKSR